MHSNYIVYNVYFKKNKLYPIGTEVVCSVNGELLSKCGEFLCLTHSENAKKHFVGNDDGRWELRGRIINSIYNLIQGCTDEDLKCDRITVLWTIPRCLQYAMLKNPETDSWIWNEEYYCAPIEDLEYIHDVLLNAPRY